MEFFWLGVVLLLSVIEMATADLITIWLDKKAYLAKEGERNEW